ncbi:MAG: hypothetical protein U9R56_01730, partial [candidate division Zixibacteria bacterium]|nr:hypothetical protein [candidate division Zixibacteria bacterium]
MVIFAVQVSRYQTTGCGSVSITITFRESAKTVLDKADILVPVGDFAEHEGAGLHGVLLAAKTGEFQKLL